jgi:hypothetical protein
MNVVLLGAGASKAYDQSKTRQKMPIAKDFFSTFFKLDISEKPDVLIGDLVNYLRDNKKLAASDFMNYSENIEDIHSEISDRLIKCANGENNYYSTPRENIDI